MPVFDDVKAEAKKASEKGLKYALQYFWDYYKFIALGIIIAIILVVSLVKTIVTNKPAAFEAILIDAYASPSDEAAALYLGIDTDKYSVMQDITYQFPMQNGSYTQQAYTTAQKLAAVVATKEADVIVCGPNIFNQYKDHILGNLENFFSKEFLDSLGDKVIYATIDNSETGESSGPYPMAIDVTDAPWLCIPGIYSDEMTLYYCIVPNTQHPEYCVKYYDFLYSEVKIPE